MKGIFAAPKDGVPALISVLHRLGLPSGTQFPDVGVPTFIDVGANKGLDTIRILELWAKFGHRQIAAVHPQFCHSDSAMCHVPRIEVHALELNPDNAATLRRTSSELRFGDRVHIHNIGASDSSGTKVVCTKASKQGSGDEHATLLGDAGNSAEQGQANARCIPVNVTSLDDFASSHGLSSLHYVKIDAEGFDARVLLGATNLMSQGRIGVLTFECCHLWHLARLPRDAFLPRGTTPRNYSALTSLVHAARLNAYDTYLLSHVQMLRISLDLYTAHELEEFERCGWCNFALIRRIPHFQRIPALFNLNLDITGCLT